MPSSFYAPPESEPDLPALKPRKRGRWLAVAGVALFTGPLWGMAGTALGMTRAFNTLSEKDAAETERLSGDVGMALASTAAGILAGVLGAALILLALFTFGNRERWFRWWSLGLAVLWCVTLFPFGLIAGLPVLISFIAKRQEFLPSRTHAG